MYGSALPSTELIEPANVTWDQARGRPEISTPLDRLPEGLHIPDDFPEPIHYDPERRLLLYRGFMTSMSYKYLRGLSTDLTFLAALDVLNVRSSTASLAGPSMRRRIGWALGSLLAAGLILAAWALLHTH